MTLADLPLVDAVLNGVTAGFLVAGLWQIRHGRTRAHAVLMSCAFATSMLFLACYLLHKFTVGVTRFEGEGWVRPVYFFILGTHTVLAAVNVPLILRTMYLAARGRYAEHRRLARWTWPSWMYVSVTGVLVYLMLYQWFPA